MFKNHLCRLLDIEQPLIQGGMARIAGGRLAAAVSDCGCLGIIGAAGASSDWIKGQIGIAERLSSRPVGVNLMLASPNIDEQIDTVIESGIKIVTTGGGNPGKYMEKLKTAGIKVIPVVSSVALARRMDRLGADAVVAEGSESGGHIGEMSTMCLVPMVVDAVDIPVIAAGGIGDGRGFVAALALGASGVQMGTRFICARECDVHSAYQEKLIKTRDRATVVCGESYGRPVRAVHNSFTRVFKQMEKAGVTAEELQAAGAGKYALACMNGDIEQGSILAGQICGLVDRVESAGDIVASVLNGAGQLARRIGGFACQE